MKKTLHIIFLTALSSMLSAQTCNYYFDRITICYTGDSTLLTEEYEINLMKQKAFYKTAIMNYLDIKGGKLKYRVKIPHAMWNEIKLLANRLYESPISSNIEEMDKRIVYSVSFLIGEDVIQKRIFYTELVPTELKSLFRIMREEK